MICDLDRSHPDYEDLIFWYASPHLWSVVPQNPAVRRAKIHAAGLKHWYEQAGYSIEAGEYTVQPERKGWFEDPETGSPVNVYVVSRDAWFRDDWSIDDSITDRNLDDEAPDQPDPGDSGSEVDLRATELELEFQTEDKIMELASLCKLTSRETEVLWWLCEGNTILGVDFLDRLSTALDCTPMAAKRAWLKTKAKVEGRYWEQARDQGRLLYVDIR